MAPYFYDPLLDQDRKRKEEQEFKISGESPTANAQGQSVTPASGQTGFNTGSGFTNLDKYLKANEGSDFGNQVYSKVENVVNQAPQALSEREQQFKQQVNQNNPVYSVEQIQKDISEPSKANKSEFQRTLNQSYKGPLNLSETPGLQQKGRQQIENAVKETELLGHDTGRFQLFDKYFGRPGYTQGQKKLDSLIYQGTRPAEKEDNLRQMAKNLESQERQQQIELGNYGAQKKGEVERSREAARSGIGLGANNQVIEGPGAGALGNAYEQNRQRAKELNEGKNSRFQRLSDFLKSKKIPTSELKRLDIENFKGHPTFEINPSDYLKSTEDYSEDSALPQDKRDYLRALEDLAGLGHRFGETTPKNPEDYLFQRDRFNEDVQNEFARNNTELYRQHLVDPAVKELTIKEAYQHVDRLRNFLREQPNNQALKGRMNYFLEAIARTAEVYNRAHPGNPIEEVAG